MPSRDKRRRSQRNKEIDYEEQCEDSEQYDRRRFH